MSDKGRGTPAGRRENKNWSTADFYFGSLLGEGLFGKVYFAKFKQKSLAVLPSRLSPSGGCVAVKVIDKVQITKKNKQKSIIRERRILSKMTSMNSPWVISLYMSFVDKHHLYMVMELGAGGTLYSLVVTDEQKMNGASIQYYCGQIICALEHLHSHSIYHCDLKPQNIVFSSSRSGGGVKLIDFDCAIDLSDITFRANDDVRIEYAGTADYAAPEVMKGSSILSHEAAGKIRSDASKRCFAAVDLWSYGCLVYFMFTSRSPFHTESDYKTMQKVLSFVNTYRIESNEKYLDDCSSGIEGIEDSYISWTDEIKINAKDLIMRLLAPEPFLRLGVDNIPCESEEEEIRQCKYNSIRQHAFFQNLDWGSTEKASYCDNQTIVAPNRKNLGQLKDNNMNMIDGACSEDIIEHFL